MGDIWHTMKTIRMRLTLSHLLVILVAMVLSGFLLLSLLQGYFLQAMEDSLRAQALITAQALFPGAVTGASAQEIPSAAYNTVQQTTSNIELQAQNVAPANAIGPYVSVDLAALTDASLRLSSLLETRIRILDASGVVLVDSQQQSQGLDLADDPLVGQALSGQEATISDPRGKEGSPVMHFASPVLVNGRPAAIVYLSQPLRDYVVVVGDLRSRWLLSTAVAILLSGVVGLLLSSAITRPLRRLTAAAGAVAQGDLDHQVTIGSHDELGNLSQAFNDMTARLRDARQTQVDFVANVSHELRTPLTAIKGFVETLRDGAVDDLKVRDSFLESMEDETDRLIRLVNDLLVLSRADSEALSLRREPTDLAALADSTVRRMAMAPSAETMPVRLVLDAPPECPLVLADADRIEQVLMNLLDNAVKYSRPGGLVVVSLEPHPPSEVMVQIQDQGLGIPKDEIARIGERFFRSDRARSRADGGSGLGLAIARALVQAHGGKLSLESEEGTGTVVSFTLPALN
jgi:signal transduction histidine kinase